MTQRISVWMKAALAACALAFAAPEAAKAQASDPFIGEIIELPYNFCPTNWVPTNGALMQISQYSALFSLLGTTYGGDGRTTFALPYIPPRTLRDGSTVLTCISLSGVFPSRN